MTIMKGLIIIHSSLSLILEGNYVSFGAMLFYSDSCILQLLSSLSLVIGKLEFSDLMTIPKLIHSVFSFLRSLFTSNMLIVSVLPENLFHYFIQLLINGVSCDGLRLFFLLYIDELTVKYASSTVDSLATFMYVNSKGCLESFRKIQALIGDPQSLWSPYAN